MNQVDWTTMQISFTKDAIKDGNDLLNYTYALTNVDLNGSASSLVHFMVQDIDGHSVVSFMMTKPQLLSILKNAAVTHLKKQGQYLGDVFSYTCPFSVLMAQYASSIRNGAKVGDGYILQPQDVRTLLQNDPWSQSQVDMVLGANGYSVQKSMNGLPLIADDLAGHNRFIVPDRTQLSNQCSLNILEPNQIPSLGPETPGPGPGPGGGGGGGTPVSVFEKEDKTMTYLAVGGIAALAGVGIYYMAKK